MRARTLIGSALAAICCAAPLLARGAVPSVETSVDPARIERGDTLSLRIRLRGDAAESRPDLTLLAADFEVRGVQQTHRTSILNGVFDRSVDWVVGLVPRRAGALVIPALPVGSASTEPIRVEVTAGLPGAGADAGDGAASAEPVRVEVEADRAEPYEHERVLLRVRLLAGAEILDGALGEPELSGAAVETLGGDRPISREIAGREWRGIERSYAVVPDASGELTLPSIRFEGHVAAPRPPPASRRFGGSLFERFLAESRLPDSFLGGFFGGGSLGVVARSEPLVLHVHPRPAAADGQWWLPARSVEVSESFDPAPAALRVGEPFTRRIEIHAEGVSPAQLPPPAVADVPGVKQYAEAPSTAQDSRGSVQLQETTLIATRPGTMTLPPVEIAWWDVQADAPRTAALPAHELEVLPAAGEATPPEAPLPAAPAPSAAPPEPHEEAAPASVPSLAVRHAGLLGACAALLAAAVFLGGRAAWRARRPAAARAPSVRGAERALRQACLLSDAPAAEAALRTLGRALDPGALGLDAAAAQRLGGPELAREIAGLHAARYSRRGELVWDGRALWQSYRRARRRRWRRAPRPALPPLYPAPPGRSGHRAG